MSNVREQDSTRPNLTRRVGISLATLALLGAGAVSASQAFAETGDGSGKSATPGTTTVQADSGKGAKPKAIKPQATKGMAKAGKADDGRLVAQPFPAAGEALQTAVNAVLPGATITEVRGQRTPADEHNPENVSASVDLGPSSEGISVFFLTGGWGGMSAEEYVNFCPDDVDDCQVSTLPDGTLVKTYSQVAVETPTGPWTLYRVDRLVDGVVIGVNAAAGRAEDGSVLGPKPPVMMQQLVDIAAQLPAMR